MTRDERSTPQRLVRAGVTDREAEVLWAVAERLRNREIAARLHVSVRTVESHVAALLRKLAVPDRAALVEAGAQLRRAVRVDTALPVPLTSLVGRESDTGVLAALLNTHRLVTLIGPGGVGKTRLALRVATVGGGRFAGGVRFADLAPVGPALVGDALARALGVVPESGWSLREVLREVAADLDGLLVVDNCEHVVAEVADLVADLLTAGGELRVLATSREPIGVPGEVRYPVRPLEVPPVSAAGAGSVAAYGAVRLFVDRAATVSPGFTLSDATAPAVAALCRRLDGLPLAIELAASRLRTFGPVELVEHLDQRFELLSAGARTAPARQRTLRGAIDWSYTLLDEDERTLFDRLGVFPADFDFTAVASVCGGEDLGEGAVVALLPRLVDKSLVTVVGGDTRRYRLLETIRAYAAERLAASGAEPAVRQRHALHYIAFAEHAAERLRTADQRDWLERLASEQPNLRTALAHNVQVGDLDAAWRAIAALQRFWDVVGQRHEAHEWIRRTLAVGDPPATPVAATGLAAASTILQPVDGRAAFDLAGTAADLAAQLDGRTRAVVNRAVGMSAMWIRPELTGPAMRAALAGFGDDHPWERGLTLQGIASTAGPTDEALQAGRDSVAMFRSVGDHMYAANTLFIMAQRSIQAGVGDDEVHGWLTESQALAEAAGSEVDTAHAYVGLAQLAWLRGEHEDAAGLMGQWLPTLRRLGDRRCTGRALYILGEHAHETGQLARAAELLRGSIEAITVAGQSFVLVRALEALAAVSAAQHRHRDAAVLLGDADRVRLAASAHLRPLEPPREPLRRSLVQAMGAAAFDSAHREGAQRSPADELHLVPEVRGTP
jgi:predicted ATPase/DNA-binding CsgD family transcriptional regulator